MDTGPSIRGVCRILNQNSCGSGSICGIQPSGNALILTNAHVAGTKIGRIVKVEVESTGDSLQARVIMAGYSDKTATDWAMLETTEPYTKVEPVFLSKKKPTGSHYTKGFPRCRPHAGTDIQTVEFNRQGVWFWEPDAIGGQSGSGVWSDIDNLQYGLLTWQWGGHGAGQQTAVIYEQARQRNTNGAARPDGLVELDDFEWDMSAEERGADDPIIENGFFAETNITTLPVWAEDKPVPPTDPDDPTDPEPEPPVVGSKLPTDVFIEYLRDQKELYESWLNKLQEGYTPDCDDDDCDDGGSNGGGTFGL